MKMKYEYPNKMKKKVVITGISLVTPLGLNKKDTWQNLVLNKSGFSSIKSFKLKGLNSNIGGEIKQLIGKNYKWGKIFSFLMDELINIELIKKKYLTNSTLCVGSAFLGIENFSFNNRRNYYISKIKKKYHFNGGVLFNSNTCAAGNFAIIQGANLIQAGLTNIAICVGIDILSPFLFAGFDALRSLSKGEAMPFSSNRDGMALGEGGGLLVLESLDSALQRGANIYCEYAGFGASCDNSGISSMDKIGVGIKKCFEMAMDNSGIKTNDIDCISTHGTGTKLNDMLEAKSILSFFGNKVELEAFKSYFGHAMGASSAIEACLLAMAFQKNTLIKIKNLDSPQYRLNFVTKNKNKKINYALNNAFGFGGINSCLVFKRYKGN